MYNKTIKSSMGYYFSGFVDGEGSFNLSFRKRDDYKTGWKISACFNVSQKERVILALLKKHLKCGKIRQRKDGIYNFEVNNLKAISENVIPFFNKFGFLSQKKKQDFAKFKKIVKLMTENVHFCRDGIIKILKIRRKMNNGGKRKFSEKMILKNLKN